MNKILKTFGLSFVCLGFACGCSKTLTCTQTDTIDKVNGEFNMIVTIVDGGITKFEENYSFEYADAGSEYKELLDEEGKALKDSEKEDRESKCEGKDSCKYSVTYVEGKKLKYVISYKPDEDTLESYFGVDDIKNKSKDEIYNELKEQVDGQDGYVCK